MNKYIILGHENPDVDSIVSGYLLEHLMRQLGYDAMFVIPDDVIDLKSVEICLEYGLNPYDYQRKLLDWENYKFILVDHHERDVLGEIVAIIDHHPTMKDVRVPYYCNYEVSSTTCLICNDETEKYFTKEDLALVLVALMVDTV